MTIEGVLTVLAAFMTVLAALTLLRFLAYWFAVSDALWEDRPLDAGDVSAFSWHFFIPCRDEEAVIGTSMARLRETYPGCHVWVIDDHSEDGTRALIEERAAWDDHIHLVARRMPAARLGKGAALNAAYRQLSDWLPAGADRGDVVVCVVDADGQLAGNALEQASAAFADPDVGGAQIGVRMRNAGEKPARPGANRLVDAHARWLVRMQDVEFSVNNAGMQILRRRTGSVGLGGNGQFVRLTALDSLADGTIHAWPDGALLEDYESGLLMRLEGWELTHLEGTYVSQEAVTSTRRFLTQRTRWAQGNLQCLRYLPRIVNSPHYTVWGKWETVYTLLQGPLHVLLALTTTLFAALTLVACVQDPGAHVFAHMLLPGALFLVAAGPLALWGTRYRALRRRDARRGAGVVWGLGLWLYTYHLFWVSCRGLARIVLGRNGWAKTRRNAEAVGVGPIAKEV
ncbi:glycosyltransferase [Streptomyces sp. SID8379]|uniref:glycosyltransferase n=1 Tax=unclassified Streptomyces TaxID=2593676 RepID=UPI00037E45C4|nr:MULTISPECIES: glycosyltransferase family 2 protein [unclassified Streptomyces]MYW65703.1 glycosyltransferase [Streptomyces sp. SID8379]